MIRTAKQSDWEIFSQLSDQEGWRVPQSERQLFQETWPDSALALREDNTFCAMVTAVAHEKSGWIGNLIVPPSLRGKGYGLKLFQTALELLELRDVSTVWLTASDQGRPIYEKVGFIGVDRIERWTVADWPCSEIESEPVAEELLDVYDQLAWGEARSSFLTPLVCNGQVITTEETVALLQSGPDLQILGPWYSRNLCPRANRQLLQRALALADPGVELVVDLLASSPVRQLLIAAGFNRIGSTDLMVRGEPAGVDLTMMVALGSLGSVG